MPKGTTLVVEVCKFVGLKKTRRQKREAIVALINSLIIIMVQIGCNKREALILVADAWDNLADRVEKIGERTDERSRNSAG